MYKVKKLKLPSNLGSDVATVTNSDTTRSATSGEIRNLALLSINYGRSYSINQFENDRVLSI